MKHPSPTDMRNEAEAAISDLPALVAAAEKAAENVLSGGHKLRRPGVGENFWQFRDYETYDSPQDIDWRQSAKGDRLFIRQKERQSAQSVCLWCAGGPSMRFASGGEVKTKAENAALLVLALALLMTRGGEQVALIGGNRRPGKSEHALRRLAEQLSESIAANKALPDLNDLQSLPRGHTAVLAGDFLEPPEETSHALRELNNSAGAGLLIQVLDPAELELPYTGRALFHDSNRTRRHEIESVTDVREAYKERIQTHIAAVSHACRERGWLYCLHRTDTPVGETLHDVWAEFSPENYRQEAFS